MRRRGSAAATAAHPSAVAAAIALALGAILCSPPLAGAVPRVFDLDIDDRNDPVRPGDEAIYELRVENSFLDPAPGATITVLPPPGTSFAGAWRAPDWSEVAATVFPDRVELALGDLESCGALGLPACRDVWVALRVDPAVPPGTVIEHRAELTSTDPDRFPPHRSGIFTSVGSAAIRAARVAVPPTADGRDCITVEADLARAGRRTPLDPLPSTIDPARGVRVVLRAPGGAVALDLEVPGEALRCRAGAATRCRLADATAWRPLGLDRLDLFLPAPWTRRNNAHVLVRTTKTNLPAGFGPELEIAVESGGEAWTDVALLRAGSGRFAYRHRQSDP